MILKENKLSQALLIVIIKIAFAHYGVKVILPAKALDIFTQANSKIMPVTT